MAPWSNGAQLVSNAMTQRIVGAGTLVALACGGGLHNAEPDVDGSAPVYYSSGGGATNCPAAHDGASVRAATPREHRVQATSCAPSPTACTPDAGACSTTADCALDAATTPVSYCVRGQCGPDECLDDSDCPSHSLCNCATPPYDAGPGCYHPNLCVPANCHADADCGPGGFCSPSFGPCQKLQGFYCHEPSDACFDNVDCCGSSADSCMYAPAAGAWSCGPGGCTG